MSRTGFLLGVLLSVGPLSAATYYVDSTAGDDANPGLSPAQPWKSLKPINDRVFQPGDRILFKAGTRYTGQLAPKGSGAVVDGKPLPILIDMYGDGPQPRIDGEGKVLDALLLRNVEFWLVCNLDITNHGPDREPWRTGVRIIADGFGPMRQVRLNRLHVHDVNGDLRKSREGCGIFFESRGGDASGNGSRFNGLLIENCHLERTDRNGICQRSRGGPRSTNVVIRRNLLEDIGGDGIKLWGTDGGLVEGNVIRGGRMRCDDAAAGIWPFDSDGTVVQYNEVSGFKGTRDGQAFDSDYRCRDSTFQYNYSHDNEGGFMLLCSPGTSYCDGTVVRYNISQNDGVSSARVFQLGGNVTNARVYNNTIYVGPKQDLPLVSCNEWNRGNPKDVRFCNNIFYVEGRVGYLLGKGTNLVFENNVFFGNHESPPADPHAVTARPPLVKPGSGGSGFDSLGGYRLSGVPDAPTGTVAQNNGGRDFFGNPVPADRPPRVGACEAEVAPGRKTGD